MSKRIRYILLTLFLYFGNTSACIVGAKEIKPNDVQGFIFKATPSEVCTSCSEISISNPKHYKSVPFSHVLFSLFHNGQLVSKTMQSNINKQELPEFFGIVSSKPEFSYEVTFEYGKGRCMQYKVVFKSENGS